MFELPKSLLTLSRILHQGGGEGEFCLSRQARIFICLRVSREITRSFFLSPTFDNLDNSTVKSYLLGSLLYPRRYRQFGWKATERGLWSDLRHPRKGKSVWTFPGVYVVDPSCTFWADLVLLSDVSVGLES